MWGVLGVWYALWWNVDFGAGRVGARGLGVVLTVGVFPIAASFLLGFPLGYVSVSRVLCLRLAFVRSPAKR